jgi:hypothetical protein
MQLHRQSELVCLLFMQLLKVNPAVIEGGTSA